MSDVEDDGSYRLAGFVGFELAEIAAVRGSGSLGGSPRSREGRVFEVAHILQRRIGAFLFADYLVILVGNVVWPCWRLSSTPGARPNCACVSGPDLSRPSRACSQLCETIVPHLG